jgi:hypothetical protein
VQGEVQQKSREAKQLQNQVKSNSGSSFLPAAGKFITGGDSGSGDTASRAIRRCVGCFKVIAG